ncbi:MAG: sigma-70 family RNA polymerase sigma factor [Planctomycetes bacterium]|nr:sigma-70 family RNA polymerase sigma factor [Planctomycetota bacterium]
MSTCPTKPEDRYDLAGALAAVRGGDTVKLAEIAERYYPRVRRMVQRSLRNDFRRSHSWIQLNFSTGDVVQNVFLRVLPTLSGVRCTEEPAFLRFLATAVENHLLDTLRHHQAGRRDARRDAKSESAILEAMTKPAPDNTPSYDASFHEHERALRAVVRALSDRERLVWRLRAQDELAWAEVAEQMNYASADVARQAFNDTKAKILIALRRRGFAATRTG